jgi:chloramphenicol-sensitive protein RarD
MPPREAPGGEARLALGAGVAAYVIWGLVPLAFQALGRLGVGSWEILAHRTVWGAPAALAFVLLAKQGRQALAVAKNPRTLAWLTASAALIAVNWVVFIWAVNAGRVLETSLGYYINPLLNMAAGALIFHERISRAGWIAIVLAAIGVAVQAFALGRLPWVSITLAVTFCGYGIVRKRVAADAQTGLLVECLLLGAPSLVFLAVVQAQGAADGTASLPALLGLIACGPLTAAPLMLFAWSARRVPLSALAFLQFIAPTMTFTMGVLQGEPFTPLRAWSFLFIWGGAAVFLWGAWKSSRRVAARLADAKPEPAPAE